MNAEPWPTTAIRATIADIIIAIIIAFKIVIKVFGFCLGWTVATDGTRLRWH